MDRIIRKKDSNFTVLHNKFLKDPTMSLKAKAFLTIVMGLPEDWDFTVKGISKVLLEKESTVRSCINELIEFGLCIRKRIYINGKIARWDYIFSDERELLDKMKLDEAILDEEKLNQDNNKENINNNKENNKRKSVYTPTPEEVKHDKWFKENFPKLSTNKRPLKLKTLIALQAEYTEDEIILKLNEMEAKANFNRLYDDVGRTLYNWLKRDRKRFGSYKTKMA